jgi:hypothetical protein
LEKIVLTRYFHQKLIFIIFILLLHLQIIAQEEEKNYYITPKFGWSTVTGNFGIEFQYKNFGINVGDLLGTNIKHYLTTGLNFYLDSHKSCFYFGIGYGKALTEREKNSNVITSHTGIIAGYRWKWPGGMGFSLGIGPLISIGEGDEGPFMLDLVLGYSF